MNGVRILMGWEVVDLCILMMGGSLKSKKVKRRIWVWNKLKGNWIGLEV